MLSPETFENALASYETGVQRIEQDSLSMGVTYLDRSIPVFQEHGDLRRLTHARHYKLFAYLRDERYEEVESLYAQVLQGYVQLEDAYGKALLLAHLAEALAAQGRWERAHSLYNLAAVVAENDQLRTVFVHVLQQQGALCAERDDLPGAVRRYEQAERYLRQEADADQLAHFRTLRATALNRLGEGDEAAALLEDVQIHYLRTNQHQHAIEPLTALRQLYDQRGLLEERNRIVQLLHLSGQRMIQADGLRRSYEHLGPPVDPGRADTRA